MVEFLHEKLPLVPIIFGDKFHGKRKLNKYETAIMSANSWILNDTFAVTRYEMKKLLSDRLYDEINEREAGTLAKRVTEENQIETPFGCGYDRINAFTANILATSIAKKITQKSLPYQGVELVGAEDKLSSHIKDIFYAVFKTQGVEISPKTEAANLVITIKSENPKNPKVTIQFTDSKGEKVKFLTLSEGEEQKVSTDIRPHYDFKNCKLFPKA